jgi:SAM-dependent methyltransferase
MGKRKRRKRKPSSGKAWPAKPRKAKGDAPKAKGKGASRRKRAAVRCSVCGHAAARCKATGWARCGSCGALFPEKTPALADRMKARDARFQGSRWSYLDDRARAEAQAEEVMRGFFRIRTGKPAALNGFGKRVLEVNCGYGNMLRAFRKYGWSPTGTETNPAAVFRAQQERLEVRREQFAEARLGRTGFDLVVFRAAFGEIVEPRRVAERLREVLRPDGLVCILREPLAPETGTPEPPESHALVYAPDSLKRLFGEAGFALAGEEAAKGSGTFWFRIKPGG